MPNQIEVKSILAKLLATEDISVEHDAKAPTAAFDVKNRKLYLPMWKDMSNDTVSYTHLTLPTTPYV